MRCHSEGSFTTVVVSYTDDICNVINKYFAVAYLSGFGGAGQRRKNFIETVGRHDDFDLHLGQEIDVVFLAAVGFFVTLLPPMAAHFADGHAVNPDTSQRVLNRIELKRLYDRFDFL